MRRLMLFIPAVAVPLLAAELKPPSRIAAVTVYSQEALVERRATAALVPGDHRLVLDGFPAALDESRLRVLGSGSAKVKIVGVRVEPVRLEKAKSDRVRELEEKIRGLEAQQAALDDKKNAANEEIAFLLNLKNAASSTDAGKEKTSDPREVLIKKVTAQDYGAFLKFYRDGVLSRRAEIRQWTRERDQVKDSLDASRRELEDLRSGQDKSLKRVTVDVSCFEGGDFTLSASYVAAPAHWEPAYDVRVLPDAKEVVVTQHALVAQQTGEDWNDVALTLSTARPSLGAATPEVTPWYLEYVPPQPPMQPMRYRMAMAKAAAEPELTPAPVMAESDSGGAAEEAMPQAVYQTAETESRGPSVVFKVKGLETIPSQAETPRKVTAAVLKFPVSFDYESVPRLAPHAYLSSKVVNDSDLPLLPGAVNVYFGGDFAGSSRLDGVTVGQEFKVPAGVDDGIKVEVENLKEKKGERMSGNRQVVFAYRLKFQSFRKEPVKVNVADRIPVSLTSKVKVSAPDFSVKPDGECRPEWGIYRWNVALNPQEKKEIIVRYTVVIPPDGSVPGL